jgi:hypothetical protein
MAWENEASIWVSSASRAARNTRVLRGNRRQFGNGRVDCVSYGIECHRVNAVREALASVYGLNGNRSYFLTSLFIGTYKSIIYRSRSFPALFFTKTLENSDTCD